MELITSFSVCLCQKLNPQTFNQKSSIPGGTKLSNLLKVRGNKQKRHREGTHQHNREEAEKGDNCQTTGKRKNLAWLKTEKQVSDINWKE